MKAGDLVFLGLGSNIQPEKNLGLAISLLSQDVQIHQIASTWETPPYGGGGGNYLNTALSIHTELSQNVLKHTVLKPVETKLGRVRSPDKFAPRTIDVDILIYHGQIIEPRLWTLPFLALPMADLLPDLADPSSGKSLLEIARHFAKEGHATLRKDLQFVIPSQHA